MASHFPPCDDSRAVALTLVTARALFCNGNLGEALLGGVGGVEGCAPGTAVSDRHPLGRYQRRLSASLYGRGRISPRPAFSQSNLARRPALGSSQRARAGLPASPCPLFTPFRSNSSSAADESGGAVAGGRRWRCFTPFEPPPASCFDPGGTPLSRRFAPYSGRRQRRSTTFIGSHPGEP